MKFQTIFILTGAVSLIFSIAACSPSEKAKANQAQPSDITPVVETIKAVKDRPVYSLSLPGELKPYEQVDIFPKAKGFVKKIYVDRGSKVKKGQLLAILEAPEVSQQYLSVQSDQRKLYEDYQYSKQAFQRLKKAALKIGAVAEIELDKVRAQFRSDSAAYIAAKAKTRASGQLEKYLRITSPFNGTITDRNVSVGALVGENNQKPLFSIAQQEHLRLTVAIPEKHAHSVNTNTPVTFTVSGRPGKVYNSRLSRNGGLLNQTTRSVMTEFDVENITKSLSGGEYAQVKLKLQRPDSTLWVPVTSLINTQSGIFILKLNNGVVQRIPVMEGSRKDSLIEVFGDITTEDQLIKKGSEELEEGTKVTIKE